MADKKLKGKNHFEEADKHAFDWTIDDAKASEYDALWPTLRTDISSAGGTWVDREVVVDSGLVTSRKPDDIPAFNSKMIEEFAEGVHREQRAKAGAV